jgi:high affinity Mn2+ porin
MNTTRFARLIGGFVAALACTSGLALAAPVSTADPGHAVLALADSPALPDPDPAAGSSAFPQPSGSTAEPGKGAARWAVFGQTTFTAMSSLGFHNPYSGQQSLSPNDLRETFDATLYLGVRPWAGGEIWATGEVDQGFGIGNAHGIAGFPSGEAYKLGKANPYTRVQRLYLRQTLSLGGAVSEVEAAANQMPGRQSANRLVITVGKFSVVDIFDTNKYAHDPRGDFLNWSLIDAGAFDYPGDPWGYTYGAAGELYWGPWTLRAGLFDMTDMPGGAAAVTDLSFFQAVGEIEHRHALADHPGAIRAALWMSRGRLGSYADALAWGTANASAPDVTQVQYGMRNRLGGYVNAEQEVTETLGLFVRASLADGRYAAWDFTDIDKSVSAGLSLTGKSWGRAADSFNLGLVVNAVSKVAQTYFAAGGMGLLIGDGTLPHPGSERIVEASYGWHPTSRIAVTFDLQGVANPAYNRDRGPVAIAGLRLHAAF